MKNIFSFCCLMFLFLGLNSNQGLADPKVSYSVRPINGTQETDFFVQVSVAGNSFAKTGTPNFQETDDFALNYISSSVQQQIINGDISFQKTFIFKLVLKKALASGEYILPKGSIAIDGNQFRLPKRTIKIEASSSSPSSQGKSLADSQSSLRNANGSTFQFIQTVSNEKPYIGEQIQYRVEIIAPDNLERAQLEEFEPQGVWRERYGEDEKRIRRVQNVSIHSFSESWFPIQSGKLQIPQRSLSAEVREFQRRRKPPMGLGSSLGDQLLGSLMPYFNQFKTIDKKVIAPPISIEVKPLPPPPTPIKGFIPVGQLKINSTIDSTDVELGEPVTLTIQVSGDANLRPLEINDPENFDTTKIKRYDDKPILSKNVGQENVTFYKTFKIALIPLVPGQMKVPSFEINWFDPIKESYETFKTKEYLIDVQGDINSISQGLNQLSTGQQNPLTDKEDSPEISPEEISSETTFYLSRASSIMVGGISLFLFFLKLISELITLIVLKGGINKKLEVRRKKIELKRFLRTDPPLEDSLEKIKTLLSLKSGISVSSLTAEELDLKLKDRLKPETIKAYKDVLNESAYFRYAGKKTDETNFKNSINNLLNKL